VKVNLILLVYNTREETDPAKARILLKLAQICLKEGQLGIMKKNLQNIETISQAWKLDSEARLSLYKESAELLVESGDEQSAYNVFKSYADKVDVKNMSEQDFEQVKLFVLFGVKVQTVTQLKDIKEHSAVKKLMEKEAAFGALLDSILTDPAKQMSTTHQKHKSLLDKVHCSFEHIQKKKQYLELSKLDKNEYSFKELSSLLGVKDAEE